MYKTYSRIAIQAYYYIFDLGKSSFSSISATIFNIFITKYRFDGHLPSGKAVEFDSTIFRRFESYMPSLPINVDKDCFVSFFFFFLENSEVRSAKAVVRYDSERVYFKSVFYLR